MGSMCDLVVMRTLDYMSSVKIIGSAGVDGGRCWWVATASVDGTA
jgi:hypothetical protein